MKVCSLSIRSCSRIMLEVTANFEVELKLRKLKQGAIIEDGTLLVGVPVHKISSWSSQIAILSSIPSWIRYQRLMTNLLNSALSPAVLPARGPTTVANLFCSYIALNAVNNVKTSLEVGKG